MWQSNPILFFSTNGTTWEKISDHNRSPLDINVERVGSSSRMVDGTLRRTTVAKKKTFAMSWENLPSVRNTATGLSTVDGGWAGEDLENFWNSQDDAFQIKLRRGSDIGKASTVETEKYTVVMTEFSKSVNKRGPSIDLWNVSLTLEEV